MSNADYYNNYEDPARRRRDPSPGHFSGGGPPFPPPGNSYPAQSPINTAPPPRSDSGGSRYASTTRVNEVYAPPSPRETMTLEPPPSHSRPRSVPPTTEMVRRGPSRASSSSFSSDSDDESRRHRSRGHRDRSPSPMSRARGVVEDNFSHSATGIGAGLLGAVVGGLVAREASEAAARHKHKHKGYDDKDSDDRTRMVSTILGAVAGGLASNAIANRVEDSRERDRNRERDWDRRRGYDEDDRYGSSRSSREREKSRDSRRERALPPADDDSDLTYGESRYDDRRYRKSEESYRYRE